MSSDYDDIINLEHWEPKNRRRMSAQQRAAQFAPFAALSGHDAAIAETARYTEHQIEAGDAINDELNQAFAELQSRIAEHPTVEVTYFEPDARKSGGYYRTVTAQVKRFDPDANALVLIDAPTIPLDAIIKLVVGD